VVQNLLSSKLESNCSKRRKILIWRNQGKSLGIKDLKKKARLGKENPNFWDKKLADKFQKAQGFPEEPLFCKTVNLSSETFFKRRKRFEKKFNFMVSKNSKNTSNFEFFEIVGLLNKGSYSENSFRKASSINFKFRNFAKEYRFLPNADKFLK